MNEHIERMVETFHDGINHDNISDPPSDTVWLAEQYRLGLIVAYNVGLERAKEVVEKGRFCPQCESHHGMDTQCGYDPFCATITAIEKEKIAPTKTDKQTDV